MAVLPTADAAQGKKSSSSSHFLAGLSGGVLSAVLLQPADLLKTRVQQSRSTTLMATIRDILQGPNALRQFWRGTLPSTIRTGFGSALYFTTLNKMRTMIAASTRNTGNPTKPGSGNSSSTLPKLSSSANLVAGAAARTFAGFVMMPVTILKVRYESNVYAYTSLSQAAVSIFRGQGLAGFFVGFGATAVRDGPYAGLYMLFYEESKRRLSALADNTKTIGTSAVASLTGEGLEESTTAMSTVATPLSGTSAASINFASGMLAAVLATAFTNPFDAIKTRLQLFPTRYRGMWTAGARMVKEEGVRSLFDGCGLRIARKGMSSALAWTLYEELIRRAERSFAKMESPT